MASLIGQAEEPLENPDPKVICVLGAGTFGTAMAFVAARRGNKVRIYARNQEQVDTINKDRINPRYLSEFEFPENITAFTDPKEALEGCDIVLHALPAQHTPDWIRANRDAIPLNAVFCSTAKGLYLRGNQLLSEAMMEAFDRPQRLAFLSGPSFARQIVEGHPTAVVVASKTMPDAVLVQRALSSGRFRVYTSLDTVGVELGGALKNPLAVGAGMIEGLGFGINTMAAYVTRATRELTVLAVAMGGRPETVAGLSGVGDLMLTAFGDLSRNRTCGLRLAKGEALSDILATATVEGVPTAEVAIDFAHRCNLDLPIFKAVAGILDGTLSVDKAQVFIMSRPLGSEIPLI